ncbi:MAG: ferritin-like domain-containing protein [Stellaceae bacterium]
MMLDSYLDSHGDAPWSMKDIPYHTLDRELVRDDALLLYIIASASFIEITSDHYTRNLIAFFQGDPEIVDWLQNHWEPEEMQHGASLKRYVQTAWPDFDWEKAYRDFMGEYGALCSNEHYASTRALEMAARCVVETGTSSFYRMMAEITAEPVLKELTAKISSDEVRHYKHFYHYFLRYQESERQGRAAVLKTLWERAMEIDDEDAFIAFKYVFLARNPGVEFKRRDYDDYRKGLRRIGKAHFPFDMALKMFLKPLGLSTAIGRMVLPPVTAATRLLMLR